jgi:hypothetical protein
MNYTDNAIETVKLTGFLSPGDFSFLKHCQDELEATWRKQQIFRTETEMRVGVLDDLNHPTRASKYWQSVREQGVMFAELVNLGFEFRRNELAIRKITDTLGQNALSDLRREELHIDLEEKQFARMNMQRVAADRIRELRLWSRIKSELDDGTFDSQDPNGHQMEALIARLEARAAHAGISSIDEACNVFGQLQTARRIQTERGPE